MKNKESIKKKVSKQGLTPKLRFPEFRDAGTWKEKLLEDVLSPIVRETKKPAEPYTRLGIRSHGKGTFLKNFENPEKNSMEYLYEVRCDDLIVNITFAWEGAVAIVKQTDYGALVSHRFPTYIFKNDRATPAFFQYKILDKQFIYNLGVISPGGAGRNRVLNKNDFLKLAILLPDIVEQQKIADCLSSIDELIVAQTQKIETLKDHKKALIQLLFPAEGKTLPKLRFSEFQGAGDWEDEPLRELYSFKTTNSFSRDKLNYRNGLVKNIHYGDIHTKYSVLFDIEKENVPFVNASENLQKIKQENYCIEGDIIFADASEDLGDIGKSIEIVHLKNQKLLSGLHTILARQKDKMLIIGFGGYLFQSDWIRTQIKKQSQGTKVLGVSTSRLSAIQVSYPSDKKEQQKIANCLSSIDDLITTQVKKLEALKEHKKGLMQQLFPAVHEVIG